MNNELRGLDDYLTTDRRDREPRQHSEQAVYLFCDECGHDAFYPISLQGVGVFCSRDCATKGSERHAASLDPRRI